jgi:hypothetical protein
VASTTVDKNLDSWKTAIRLLKCHTEPCPGSSTATSLKSLAFVPNRHGVPFLVDITCSACQDQFSVCVQCPKATSQLRTDQQIKRHCRNCHGQWLAASKLVQSREQSSVPKRKSLTIATSERPKKSARSSSVDADRLEVPAAHDNSEVEDAVMMDEENEFAAEIDPSDTQEAAAAENLQVTVTPVLQQSDIGSGCRESNAAYFYKESKVKGGGLDYLVGMAAFQVPDLDPGTLDKEEVSMHANTAEFAGHPSKPNRDRLAHHTKLVCDVAKKQTLEEVEVLAGKRERRAFLIEPLQTPNEIRMQFFDQKKSLFSLLPHPPLFECEGHTHSLCSDCIRDALGKGFDLEFITPMTIQATRKSTSLDRKVTHRQQGGAKSFST